MAVPARQSPDFRTISDCRKRHLPALGGLFTQVRPLCQKAGWVRWGHVALDGTKIRANASKHTAMSSSRMQAAEGAQWWAKAAASAAHEDAAYGVDRRGDELPAWVTHTPHRVEKIRAAKAALEAEAQAHAPGKKRTADLPSERPRRGRLAKNPPGTPPDRAPRTHSSRCWRTSKRTRADRRGSYRRMRGIASNTISRRCSATTFEATSPRGGFSAVGRRTTVPRTRVHAMTIRLKRAGYRRRYRLRKQVVEPVFGQIKQARGFRQFLLRGLSQVSGVCSVAFTTC